MSAFVTVGGREYPMKFTDDLTFGEARYIQDKTGLTLNGYNEALVDGSPDAWYWRILQTVQAVDPFFTEELLNEVKLGDVIGSVRRQDPAPDAADPTPAVDEAAPSDTSQVGETTPEAAGSPG